MKSSEVKLDGIYVAKINGKEQEVQVVDVIESSRTPYQLKLLDSGKLLQKRRGPLSLRRFVRMAEALVSSADMDGAESPEETAAIERGYAQRKKDQDRVDEFLGDLEPGAKASSGESGRRRAQRDNRLTLTGPTEFIFRYKGQDYSATMHPDGRAVMDGTPYPTAYEAFVSVTGWKSIHHRGYGRWRAKVSGMLRTLDSFRVDPYGASEPKARTPRKSSVEQLEAKLKEARKEAKEARKEAKEAAKQAAKEAKARAKLAKAKG